MQNIDTGKVSGIELVARLAERAKEYTNFSKGTKKQILRSYATSILSIKFERGFHRVADAFAAFSEKMNLRGYKIVQKVDDGMLQQELEREGEEREKKAKEKLKKSLENTIN